jgi:hypothetical protein
VWRTQTRGCSILKKFKKTRTGSLKITTQHLLLPIFGGYYQWCEITGSSQSVFLNLYNFGLKYSRKPKI